MRTSDPDIFAVGDAVEVQDFVTGQWTLIPLAGPANRQGRIVGRRDLRPRRAVPRHAGHLHLQDLRGGDRADGRQRESAPADRRHRYREALPVPELPRRLLPGRQDDGDQGAVPEVERPASRRTGAGGGRRGQADRRLRHGDPDGRDRVRPRGSGAVLRAAVRQRQGPRQLRRHGRGQPASRRHADRALERARRRLPPRRPQPAGAGGGVGPRRHQHPAAATARAAG